MSTAGNWQVIWFTQSGMALDLARNIMVTRSLVENVGKIFFVDSDMILDGETFPQMVGSSLPVVSAAYMQRSPPFEMMAYAQDQQLSKQTAQNKQRQYITVDEVGAGCLLVDRLVIERIAQKLDTWRCLTHHKKDGYEKAVKHTNKEAIAQGYRCKICSGLLIAPFFWNRMGFHDDDPVSEDFWFCHQVKRAGFDVTLINNLVVKHEPRISDWWIDQNGPQTTLTNAQDIKQDITPQAAQVVAR